MNTVIQRNIAIVLLFGLLLSSCGPGPTIVPAPTQPSTSEPTSTVPATATMVSDPTAAPTTPPQIMDRIDKLIDSNQIVTPFQPADVFMFALPDWNSQAGIDVAEKLHATVVGSCHQDINWRLSKWLDNADLLSQVTAIAHAAGLKYTAHFTVDRDNKDSSISFEEEVAVRDIDGNIIAFSMPEEVDVRIWKSVHYPQWKDYMVNLAKKAVDAGVDILCIDGWTYNYDAIGKGGDFSANSLTGFREYIQTKYSQKQLASFGISDINTFDYRVFKKSNTTDPFMGDFEDFQLSSSKLFWQAIISETREYAESQGKTVLFTVNVNINAWEMVPGLPIADSLDGFMSEYRFQLPPYNNTITEFKVFRSMGKPVVLIPNAGASAEFLQRTDLAELMKIYTAEAYATGEFIYPPYSILANSPEGWKFFDGDMNKFYPYYDFLAGNKVYYENLTSAADTAVLYSYASLKNKMNREAYNNFYGISNLLLDTHRQYDVLFAGDTVWIEDQLSMDQLNQYQGIILPNVADLSDKHLALLLEYVNLGGKILAFGETGVRSELGQPAEMTRFGDLLVEGSHPYGQGQFEYARDNYGTNYLSGRDAASRQKIGEGLSRLYVGNIQTDADYKVSILEYWNTNLEASIIHLINHDYDTQEQHINPQHNISIDISLNTHLLDKDLGVFYGSPDGGDFKELAYRIDDNRMSFTLPDLDTYGLIFIGDKNTFTAQQENN